MNKSFPSYEHMLVLLTPSHPPQHHFYKERVNY